MLPTPTECDGFVEERTDSCRLPRSPVRVGGRLGEVVVSEDTERTERTALRQRSEQGGTLGQRRRLTRLPVPAVVAHQQEQVGACGGGERKPRSEGNGGEGALEMEIRQ
jgi:hypothetical protein